MALVKTEELSAPMKGLEHLPLLRQLGIMLGLAASIALGVYVAMWSQEPNYRLLYGNLSGQDAIAITDTLQQAGIEYKLSDGSSAVMVSSDQVHDARLKLAAQGLPKGVGVGFEILQQQQSFGTSQFIEVARFNRALEGELARTISSLNNVQSVRIHLAIPKESAFLRDRKKPSASVLVNLYPGRALDEGQVASITHLVASGIPNLSSEDVTVIDQKGTLLTPSGSSDDMQLNGSQFDYRRKLEQYYIGRVEAILSPIVGNNGVKAQISADLDFTVTEQTQEAFNPDLPAIRSEQTVDEHSIASNATAAAGVPGALSNQPAGSGAVGEVGSGTTAGTNSDGGKPSRSTRRATRNYELDRTISHTRMAGVLLRQLSVAVVIDDRQVENEDGEVKREPRSEQEMERIISLVKEAIGFSVQRGDKVNVINASFTIPPEPEPLPEQSFLDNPGFWSITKQIVGVLAALLVAWIVLRPVMRELAAKAKLVEKNIAVQGGQGGYAGEQLALNRQTAGPMGGAGSYDNQLNTAKTLVEQDPKRVAQVVKNWVGTDG